MTTKLSASLFISFHQIFSLFIYVLFVLHSHHDHFHCPVHLLRYQLWAAGSHNDTTRWADTDRAHNFTVWCYCAISKCASPFLTRTKAVTLTGSPTLSTTSRTTVVLLSLTTKLVCPRNRRVADSDVVPQMDRARINPASRTGSIPTKEGQQ